MGARLAVLIAVALAAACVRAPRAAGGSGCLACHAAHREPTACTECHRGDERATRAELAHAHLLSGGAAEHRDASSATVRRGGRLVEGAACRRCHTIGGRGSRLATELDRVVGRREQRELARSIVDPVENMPEFGFDGAQAESLVAFLLHHARADGAADSYRVHFRRDGAATRSMFDAKCGPCHRALTPSGPRGTGTAGPNLSGLLGSFYPPTFREGRPWDEEALRDWLRNPRAHRSGTTMPLLVLDADETAAIMTEVQSGSDARPPND